MDRRFCDRVLRRGGPAILFEARRAGSARRRARDPGARQPVRHAERVARAMGADGDWRSALRDIGRCSRS
jgi:hypothetical protein